MEVSIKLYNATSPLNLPTLCNSIIFGSSHCFPIFWLEKWPKTKKQENFSIQDNIWTGYKWWIIIWPLDWFACQEDIKETLGKARSYKTGRLEIFPDRRDWRSCKKFYSYINFSRTKRVSFQNLYRNRKFTHLVGKFIHTFSLKLLKFYIFISISIKKDQNQSYKNYLCFID